jgi:hypothetical protein
VSDGDFKDIAKEANALAKKSPGRPKGSGGPTSITKRQVQKARELFEPLVHKAVSAIEEILDDPDADPSVKLKAAKECLDRRFGTSVNMQVVEKIVTDERRSPLSEDAIKGADTAYLEQALVALSRFVEHERNTVDITPELSKD